VLNPVSIALVAVCPAGVGFLYIICLPPVNIPRLVTWGGVGKVFLWLILLDPFLVPW